MVDHVEFAESGMINSFIEPWRQSGTQRIGWMYGHYEPYELVPLGIKAVVEAIYEPAQSGEYDGITITEITQADGQPQPPHIATAEACGLVPLGVIFTDLVDAGNGDGSVICKRHADSYFCRLWRWHSLEPCRHVSPTSRGGHQRLNFRPSLSLP